jgi:GNAT superfamily N-acetyltransferase
MTILIRDADPPADYERIAALITLHEQEHTTSNHIHDWDRNHPEGMIRRRAVAVNQASHVVGYSVVQHHPRDPLDHFYMLVMVDTPHLRQGIGSQLFADAVAFAQRHSAAEFTTFVQENQPDGLAFAEKRGFRKHKHTFSSERDLTTFDAAAYTGILERPTAAGIRFTTLADEGNTPEAQHKLWDINRRAALDNPGSDGSDAFPSFEIFQHQVLNAGWFRPAGQILAVAGDAYVGLGAVLLDIEDPTQAYNAFLGVDAAYRGRGIAQALKLLTLRFAQDNGARVMRTDNDSHNASMLAINQKFGYVRLPGRFYMIKK